MGIDGPMRVIVEVLTVSVVVIGLEDIQRSIGSQRAFELRQDGSEVFLADMLE